MKYKIPLTQGKWALVDEKDFVYLLQWKWYYNGGYAVRGELVNGKLKTIYMHRVVLERKLGHNNFEETHHNNRIKLHNQRENLQAVTHAQNQRSSGKYKNNISGYKGVSWFELSKKMACSNKSRRKTKTSWII